MTDPKPFPLESHLPPEQLPGLVFRFFFNLSKAWDSGLRAFSLFNSS